MQSRSGYPLTAPSFRNAHYRNRLNCRTRRFDGVGTRSHDQIVGDARQYRGQPGQPLRMTVRIDRFDREVFAFNPSQLPQALAETIDVGVRCDGEPANARTLGLRTRRHRPRNRRAAEQRYELAPLQLCSHSITSSAATSNLSGTVRPSAWAVLKLRVVSYLLGACTGRSAGLAPRRMRST